MYFRPVIPVVFAIFVFAAVTGCEKPTVGTAPPPTVLSPQTIASIHWAGKHHLDLDADAYYLSRIWSLPETERLQNQTLDRFSYGFWRQTLGEQAATRIPTVVLRSLCEELMLQESYFEIRADTGAAPAFVLAVKNSVRSEGIWGTNAAIAAELLAGTRAIPDPVHQGWMIHRTNAPSLIALARVGDWDVISAGPVTNMLFQEISARIQRDGVPFVSAGTNLWLEASLDLPRLAKIFPLSAGGEGWGEVGIGSVFNSQRSTLSRLYLSLSGDGANVITRARLTLAKPLPALLPSWHLPVALMHEPLASFTAVRQITPLLAACSWLQTVPWSAPPDQMYLWSLTGSPYQVYLAAPLPDAPGQVKTLSADLMQRGNPWLANHGYINFDPAADGNGVTWGNLPAIRPFLKSAAADGQGFLYAGLFPDTNQAALPPPAGMIQDVLQRTNLLYYDWEVTGPRLANALELAQTIRLITRQPQVPPHSASVAWLNMLVPRLRTSATIISQTGPDELTLYRRSTLGLTAMELQILTGWLESPQFPW